MGDGIAVEGSAAGYSVAMQTDGKIVVAGPSYSNSGYDKFGLSRYNNDGSLDTSFSDDGKVTTGFNSDATAWSVAIQADGKILVAGEVYGDFAVIRYNTNGSLDTSFSGDGIVTTDFGGKTDFAHSVQVLADGKIMASGGGNIARYNSDGSLDTSFDGDGKMSRNTWDVIIQKDGKMLSAKYVYSGGTYDFAVLRFNSDGTVDTTFSGDGIVTTGFGPFDDEYVGDFTLQADGKILVGGSSHGWLALARYNSNGTLDTSFSGDGKLINTKLGTIEAIAVQTDGKIIVAGEALDIGYGSYLARYNKDGSLDTSFSGDGKVDGVSRWGAFSVTIQQDGKIILTGEGAGIARYTVDGSLDQTFNSVNTLNGSPTFTENGSEVVLDNTVKIYDYELANQGNYNGASVTLTRHGGANSQDIFGSFIINGNDALLNKVVIGTVSNANGILKITFNTNATQDRVNTALSLLTYKNSSDAPPTSVQIDWTFNDGNTGAQGTGGALSALGSTTVLINPVNDAPVGSVIISGQTFQGKTLTASNTLTDADGLGAITYTWKTGSTVLGTGNSYTLKATDVGHTVTTTASYTDKGGTAESITSAASATVGTIKTGTVNADTLSGSAFDDLLYGLDGNDILYGNNGNDVLEGGNGDDTLDGGAGKDKLVGGAGNDIYIVDSVDDVVTEASNGGDLDYVKSFVSISLAANVEKLLLVGSANYGEGNDLANTITGNIYDNFLVGLAGADIISSGGGNDLLVGGIGNDTLTGGAGKDTFVFIDTFLNNIDKITDFNIADDSIDLAKSIFTKLTATGVLNAAYLKIGTAATDANDFIVYNKTTGALFYDADGNGAGAAVQIAILGVNLGLTNADFEVI